MTTAVALWQVAGKSTTLTTMDPPADPAAAAAVVLIVEDDHDVGDRLQRTLAEVGLRTERAVTGQQALAALDRAMPALLLLDLSLPDMYGEAVGIASRQRYGDAVPIVVVSAFLRHDPCLPPLRAAAVVLKPFNLADLLGTVARFVPLPLLPTSRHRAR
jgi:two-component system, OmpR family, response regulator AdeR